jgi:hypothetical protein
LMGFSIMMDGKRASAATPVQVVVEEDGQEPPLGG